MLCRDIVVKPTPRNVVLAVVVAIVAYNLFFPKIYICGPRSAEEAARLEEEAARYYAEEAAGNNRFDNLLKQRDAREPVLNVTHVIWHGTTVNSSMYVHITNNGDQSVWSYDKELRELLYGAGPAPDIDVRLYDASGDLVGSGGGDLPDIAQGKSGVVVLSCFHGNGKVTRVEIESRGLMREYRGLVSPSGIVEPVSESTSRDKRESAFPAPRHVQAREPMPSVDPRSSEF